VTNPARIGELIIRGVDGDVLVHDTVHEKVHVLNASAGYVLELCDGTRPVTQIARLLSDATGADPSVVTRDVDAILREFALLELLVGAN
jgi:hypothetical protein